MAEQLVEMNQQLENTNEAIALFGVNDAHLKVIERELNVSIVTRGETVHASGAVETVTLVEKILQQLLVVIRKGVSITERDVAYAIQLAQQGKIAQFEELYEEEIFKTAKGKSIRVKTMGQRRYIHAMKKNDIVFGIGPAGTGKTYLAVVMAVRALKQGYVKKIILTRPAVEAGESLGFLPGDLQEKIDPYLRPIYDAMFDILGYENFEKFKERGLIEVAPLAYMRGRTLDNAYIILDEAQNTTNEQMKMFLTRIGYGSKAIVTGDITQVDLPRGKKSGLLVATNILRDIKGISFLEFEKTDVVRHPLVQKIIGAYEKLDNNRSNYDNTDK